MAAPGPQGVGVVVGGLHPLALWVDAAQSLAVVLQEVVGAALPRHLVLHKGADLFVGVTLCRKKNGADHAFTAERHLEHDSIIAFNIVFYCK